MRLGQAGVEAEGALVEVQQVQQRPQHRRLAHPLVRPVVPVPAGVGDEPADPGRQVEDEAEREGGQPPPEVAEQPGERPGNPGRPPRLHPPEHDQRGEERQEEQPAPLDPAGQPEQRAGGEQPPRHDPRNLLQRPVLQRPQQAAPVMVPVEEHRCERCQHEQPEEDVQQRGPRQHQLKAVQRHQQTGQAGEHDRVEHAVRDPDQDEDHQGPGEGGGETPSQLDVAEDLLPERDQPLAQRWMDHVPGGVRLLVPLHAVLQHVPGVGRVVDLVEDVPLGVADPREPQDSRGRRDDHGDQPGVRIEPVLERRQPPPHDVGHATGSHRRIGHRRCHSGDLRDSSISIHPRDARLCPGVTIDSLPGVAAKTFDALHAAATHEAQFPDRSRTRSYIVDERAASTG